MDFERIDGKVAGAAGALLQDDSVREVMSHFGDGCMRCYGMDIRQHKSYLSAPVLRKVRSFVAEYGASDAVKIVDRLFSPVHDGRDRGRNVGLDIFDRRFSYLANRYLSEVGDGDGGW